MELNKINTLDKFAEFLTVVNKCQGDVFLKSIYGDMFNLKSTLSAFTSIGALLSERGSELELFCSNTEDEELFFEYFRTHEDLFN